MASKEVYPPPQTLLEIPADLRSRSFDAPSHRHFGRNDMTGNFGAMK